MADFLVTRLDDSEDAGLSGLSLRQAVAEAAAAPGADRVVFADGLSGNLVLTGGPLRVSDATTVLGPERGGDGAPLIVVDGAGGSRVFEVQGAVTLGRLAIEGGLSDESGGGVFAAPGSDLTLDGVVIRDNVAPSGAGLYLGEGASLAVRSSDIVNNEASGSYDVSRGGGVFAAGGTVVTIADTLVRGNYAANGGGGFLQDATVTITGSTFDDNGNAFGAHLGVYGSSSLTVRDTTMTRVYGTAITAPGDATVDIEAKVSIARSGDVGKGDFSIFAGDRADRVAAESGDGRELVFRGGDGSNVAIGGDGNDIIEGAEEPVDPARRDGADRFFGQAGADEITGGYDDDFLNGGLGADTIRGGAGDDTLIGGPDGGDRLNGGAGADVFVLLAPHSAREGARIEDWGDGDRIALDDRLFLGTALEGITDVRFNPRDVTDALVAAALGSGVVDYDFETGVLALFRPTPEDPLGAGSELLRFAPETGLAAEDFVLL